MREICRRRNGSLGSVNDDFRGGGASTVCSGVRGERRIGRLATCTEVGPRSFEHFGDVSGIDSL